MCVRDNNNSRSRSTIARDIRGYIRIDLCNGHSYVLYFTICSIERIIYSKRGNKCDSENYRQIAISNLMGKLFDSNVLKEQQAYLLIYFNLVLRKKLPLLYVHLC